MCISRAAPSLLCHDGPTPRHPWLGCYLRACKATITATPRTEAAPAVRQGDPGPRLMRMAALLTEAAQLNGSATAAAVAARAIQGLTFSSVCRGFVTAGTPRPGAPQLSATLTCRKGSIFLV